MAEIQEQSGNRLLPMPLMPAWDIDVSIAEAKRVAAMGARGVNMTSDPQDLGLPTWRTGRGTRSGRPALNYNSRCTTTSGPASPG